VGFRGGPLDDCSARAAKLEDFCISGSDMVEEFASPNVPLGLKRLINTFLFPAQLVKCRKQLFLIRSVFYSS